MDDCINAGRLAAVYDEMSYPSVWIMGSKSSDADPVETLSR